MRSILEVGNRLILVTVNSQTTQFIYDGDGNLVKKINPNGSRTLYVGGIYEVDKASGGSVTRTVTYYPVAGAMRIDSTLYYVLKDHLGSASVVTNASGTEVGSQRYYPFGETRVTTGTIYTDKLFTGQREMAGLGIYHYQARFYSPKLGRFLSADTIVPSYSNAQSLNRYSYVLGNPVKYIDPTGHCALSGHWIPDTDAACQWASNNQGSLSGNGNGGFIDYKPDKKPQRPDLAELFNNDQLLNSWEGQIEIDSENWERLLSAIRENAHKTSKWWLLLTAYSYDTPFYDQGLPYGLGALEGTGCINGKCYSRTELNYIGQGEAWAALGFSKERTIQIVSAWKETIWNHPPSAGVLEMTEIGYDHYQELYPPSPPPFYYPALNLLVPSWGGSQ